MWVIEKELYCSHGIIYLNMKFKLIEKPIAGGIPLARGAPGLICNSADKLILDEGLQFFISTKPLLQIGNEKLEKP